MTDDLGATIGEITTRLDAAGISYMVVGPIAALVHGRARATMDVDIVIDPDRERLRAFARGFSREELGRRTAHEVFGRRVMVASVEDVIVAKLEWARIGASERQLDDARALVELAGARLDRVYVERQVDALGLANSWADLLAAFAEAT